MGNAINLLVLGGSLLLNTLAVACRLKTFKASSLVTSHGSDIRVISLTLAYADFVFTNLKIFDKSMAERYVFAPGEEVFYNGTVRNNGVVSQKYGIDIRDEETNEVVGSWTPLYEVASGAEVNITDFGVVTLIKTMPNKNWRLKFTLTP